MEVERAKIFKEYTKVIQEVETYCDQVDLLVAEVANEIASLFQKKKSSIFSKINLFDKDFKMYLFSLKSWCQQEEVASSKFIEDRNHLRLTNQSLQKYQYLQRLTFLFMDHEFTDAICGVSKEITRESIKVMLNSVGVGLPSFLESVAVDTSIQPLNIDVLFSHYDQIFLKLNEFGFKEQSITLTEIVALILEEDLEGNK